METEHVIHVADAREGLTALPDGSVELVVTSPPYPMIEMWDELFTRLDPAVGAALAAGDGNRAFELMHAVLAPVWEHVARVLVPGGIACVNVGDATRTVDGDDFRCYQNHVAVADRLGEVGLSPLPGLLWHKPVNRATKFMGSGMLPPNAYPTLEHEHVLVFRKGGTRTLEPGADDRYEAAYFWEERNEWFSDRWTLAGERQTAATGERNRSGAFPLALPLRLIRMFSTFGDRVCDPFWGTGTTTLAAMHAARDSVGYELDPALVAGVDDRLEGLPDRSHERTRDRLARHAAWAEGRDDLSYEAVHHGFRVMTKQERRIRPRAVARVERVDDGTDPTRYRCTHVPVEF